MGRLDAEVYLGLIHYPIYNKRGDKITTTITNLDLHDISRAGKTYDISRYYVINHLKSQQAMVQRMKKYWTSEYGSEYNSNRQEAFSILEIANSLEEVMTLIEKNSGKRPKVIATDAKPFPNSINYKDMREVMFKISGPYLIIFGTGWGLTEETLEKCDYILEPIFGRGDFNHLSVRSAASIIMDRLLSEW